MMIVAGAQMVAWIVLVLAVLEGSGLAALEASAPAVIEELPVVERASEEASGIPAHAATEVLVRVVLQAYNLADAPVVQAQTDPAALEDTVPAEEGIVPVVLDAFALVVGEYTVPAEDIALAALERTVLAAREDTAPVA